MITVSISVRKCVGHNELTVPNKNKQTMTNYIPSLDCDECAKQEACGTILGDVLDPQVLNIITRTNCALSEIQQEQVPVGQGMKDQPEKR